MVQKALQILLILRAEWGVVVFEGSRRLHLRGIDVEPADQVATSGANGDDPIRRAR
jgi:hypothetical protein